MPRIKILDVKIDKLTYKEATEKLEVLFDKKKHTLICTPNTEIVVLAQKNDRLKKILNDRSDLNLADSSGLLWAARFDRLFAPSTIVLREIIIILEWLFSIVTIPIIPWFNRIPAFEKISGSDFIYEITNFASKNKLKVFLLGGGPTVAERTALKLQTENPELRISGVYSGSSDNNEEILSAISKSHAKILLVAFGAPKQEIWLAENLNKTECKMAIGLGGTFDFVSGIRKRAPLWMQKSGLEWIYRLIHEPSRLKRQLALPKFLWLVLMQKLKKDKIG